MQAGALRLRGREANGGRCLVLEAWKLEPLNLAWAVVVVIHRLFDYLLCQMGRSDCGSTNAESCRCAGKSSNSLM